MKRLSMLPYLVLVVMGACLFSFADVPSDHYSVLRIEGWQVHFNNRLLTDEHELGDKVLRLLRTNLYEIERALPSSAVEKLKQVPVWVDLKSERFPGAVYHPSSRWLSEHGFKPEMAKGVHIANATNFLRWTFTQPAMVLHEMAHAYHHQVLGYDHAGIKKAYQNAKEKGIYDEVMHYNGSTQKAYALNNEQEYFAEQTEAFFAVNDFYPFVRPELKQHDPEMYDLLKKVWQVDSF